MWKLFQAGGPLMWALLFCSILSLTVILERWIFWMRININEDARRANEMLTSLRRDPSWRPEPGEQGVICNILLAGLNSCEQTFDKAMEIMALRAIGRMRRGMNLLDTIITVAPMLGIMGTVLGIISSFDMLSEAGVSEPHAVVAGIAQALITTASGLAVAVITLLPYNYFASRIDRAQDLIEMYASHVAITLSESPERPSRPAGSPDSGEGSA